MENQKEKLKVTTESQPWYQEGLRFKCTGCGQCCTGGPGAVWISQEEIELMAKHLNLAESEFIKTYTRLIDGKRSLIEDPVSYDCVFLKDNKCSLYSVRPKQCRTFPWWQQNLTSKKAWKEAAQWCEGINHPEAPIVPSSEIDSNL
ncbi:MAG: YkgJ family cysteine cluster protein [Chlamydiota bacterium]|nr:YkgJ family cysteine cluster protein [Chlamydiota bacterium]